MSPNRYVWLFVLTALGGIGCSGDDLTEDSNESHDALTTGHIQVSRSADRSASVALDGKTESGVIYVFAEGLSTSVSRVDFRLDGTLVGSEQHAPKGTSATGNANPWDRAPWPTAATPSRRPTCFRRVGRAKPRRPSRFPIRRAQAGAEVRAGAQARAAIPVATASSIPARNAMGPPTAAPIACSRSRGRSTSSLPTAVNPMTAHRSKPPCGRSALARRAWSRVMHATSAVSLH